VVSDKTDKTVVVKVERKVKHPLYGRSSAARRSITPTTRRMPSRPAKRCGSRDRALSKLKTWKVIDRVQAGKGTADRSDRPRERHVFELPDWFRQASEKEPDQ
jgi:small subunit ribosomal protein S17